MTPQKLEGYLTSRTAPDPAAAIWYPTTGCGGMSGSLTQSIQSQSGCVGGQYTLMGTRMVTTPYAFQNRMLGKWPTGDARRRDPGGDQHAPERDEGSGDRRKPTIGSPPPIQQFTTPGCRQALRSLRPPLVVGNLAPVFPPSTFSASPKLGRFPAQGCYLVNCQGVLSDNEEPPSGDGPWSSFR